MKAENNHMKSKYIIPKLIKRDKSKKMWMSYSCVRGTGLYPAKRGNDDITSSFVATKTILFSLPKSVFGFKIGQDITKL